MRLRQILWSIWHTRPGHKPYGIVRWAWGIQCAACGSHAPGGRP